MKSILMAPQTLLASLVFLIPALAQAENLHCKVAFSTVIFSEKTFSIAPGEKSTFEEADGFRFMLHNLGNSKFEIEVYDIQATTRSYANTYLRNASDELNWSFWSRSALVDVGCGLK